MKLAYLASYQEYYPVVKAYTVTLFVENNNNNPD